MTLTDFKLFVTDVTYILTFTNRFTICVYVTPASNQATEMNLQSCLDRLGGSLAGRLMAGFCFFRWNHRQTLRSVRAGGTGNHCCCFWPTWLTLQPFKHNFIKHHFLIIKHVTHSHLIRCTFLVLGETASSLQDRLHVLYHRFNKVLETFRDFGPCWHDSMAQSLQIYDLCSTRDNRHSS